MLSLAAKGATRGFDPPPQNKHKKTNEFAIFFIHGCALKLVYLLQLILGTTCIHCKTILDHFSIFFNCFIGAFELLARSINAINHHSNWDNICLSMLHRPCYDFSPQLSMGLVSESLEGLT